MCCHEDRSRLNFCDDAHSLGPEPGEHRSLRHGQPAPPTDSPSRGIAYQLSDYPLPVVATAVFPLPVASATVLNPLASREAQQLLGLVRASGPEGVTTAELVAATGLRSQASVAYRTNYGHSARCESTPHRPCGVGARPRASALGDAEAGPSCPRPHT